MLLSLFLSFVVALVWLAVTVSGLVALWRGVRGTLVNDHLHCRACGYDLEGAPSRPLQCNECGASLIGPKKVKAGRRRPRMDLVVVGLVIIALPVFGAFGLSMVGEMAATGPVTAAPKPKTKTKTKPVVATRGVRCGVCPACLERVDWQGTEVVPAPACEQITEEQLIEFILRDAPDSPWPISP